MTETLDLLYAATKLVTESRFGSPSMIRRCLRQEYGVFVPYETCEHLLDLMQRRGIVGPARGSLAREVFLDYEQASRALRSHHGGSWGIPSAATPQPAVQVDDYARKFGDSLEWVAGVDD